MKKIVLLFTIGLLVACSSDDGTTINEEVSLFVNHYQTTSILTGTALVIQEDTAIGTKDFERIGSIAGFEFEPGFTYILTATKITTKNPGTNASTIRYELISQETKEEVPPQTTFTVPLTQFVNGVGYLSFLNGDETSGFLLGNRIPIQCQNLCTQLQTILNYQDIASGEFTHREDGSYVLQELY